MKIIAWLLSLFFAFTLGAETASQPRETDEELRNKVQEHLDVIVDEGAAIVDDVTEEIRKDERVQEAEQFIQDVKDVAQDTAEDLSQVVENAKTRVEEKFGTGEPEAAGETDEAVQPEAVAEPEVPVEPEAPQETPAPGEPVNG